MSKPMRAAIPTLLAVACGGTSYQYKGHNVYDYFPLDGQRSWEYLQNDASIDYVLEVEKLANTSQVGNWQVVPLEYRIQDPLEILYTVKWSSDSTDGVLIHAYQAEGEDEVKFDTPVVFGDYQMAQGDEVVTETNGLTFTGTLVGVEECPNHWTSDWECLHMSLTVEGGDPPPFVGEYWITTGWGTSWFRPEGYDDNWVLDYAEWTPE